MSNEVTVHLAQDEANAILTILIGQLDAVDERIKTLSKLGDTDRIIDLAEKRVLLKSVEQKLLATSATLWC